jgi:hypothetical protein
VAWIPDLWFRALGGLLRPVVSGFPRAGLSDCARR